MKPTLEQRFWSKVEKKSDSDCWKWKSAFTTNGYGFFWVGGKKRSEYAHRVSYTLANGNLDKDSHVMHSCDNKWCVNPKHLSAGSHLDNMRDAMSKNRSGCLHQHGSRNPVAKVTELSVQRIRIVGNALTQNRLAELISVSRENVGQIKRGTTWSHITSNKQALA